MFDAGSDLNAVDDSAFDQIFQRPREVLWADAIHGGAEAACVVEGDDALAFFCEAACEAIDEVNFGSYGEHGACGGLLNECDQLFG